LLLIVAPITFYILVGFEFEIIITQSWGIVTPETTEIKTLIAVKNPTILSRLLKKIELDLHINNYIACEVSEKSVEIKPWGKQRCH